jgi:hypothetical protein
MSLDFTTRQAHNVETTFKVNKKMFARLKEDGKTLVVYTKERNKWMKQDPALFLLPIIIKFTR